MGAGRQMTRGQPTTNQIEDHEFSIPDDILFEDVLTKIDRNKKEDIPSAENLKMQKLTDEEKKL